MLTTLKCSAVRSIIYTVCCLAHKFTPPKINIGHTPFCALYIDLELRIATTKKTKPTRLQIERDSDKGNFESMVARLESAAIEVSK